MDVKVEDGSFVCVLDGAGGMRRASAGDEAFGPDALVWAHLRRDSAAAQRWLAGEHGVPALVRQALTAEETRPRCTPLEGGLLLILRGVNLLGINSSATPRDVRLDVWKRISTDLKPRHFDLLVTRTIGFDALPDAFPDYLAGRVTGRTIVRIG